MTIKPEIVRVIHKHGKSYKRYDRPFGELNESIRIDRVLFLYDEIKQTWLVGFKRSNHFHELDVDAKFNTSSDVTIRENGTKTILTFYCPEAELKHREVEIDFKHVLNDLLILERQ